MSSALHKAGVAAAAAAAGAAIAVGGAQLASAGSATATAGVNIRSGPGTSYAVVGGLVRGQAITTVGTPHSGWTKVRFNGGVAYISAQYLSGDGKTISSAPVTISTQGFKIASAPLNVRQTPALDAQVVGYIAEGQQVTLTGKQSRGYAEVLYGGQRAWVSAQYLVSSMHALPSSSGTRYATADLLVRTTTDADFKIITTVAKGSTLHVTGATSNGYAQVVYGNAIRWVTAQYLSSKAIAGPAPVATTSPKTVSTPVAPVKKAAPVKQAPVKQADPVKKAAPAKKAAAKKASKPAQQAQPAPAAPAPQAIGSRYATTELLVRTTAGSDYQTVDTVHRGETVQITGATDNGRAQIIAAGTPRWVTAQYLSTSKPHAPEPAPAAPAQSAASHHPAAGHKSSSTTSSTAAKAASQQSGNSGGAGGYSGSSRTVSGSTWDDLAMCESSGNWSINSGNGFYGGLQFTLQTWHGFGGTGQPQYAGRAEQITVAERVLAAQGWGAWPACSTKLGLR